MVLALVLDLATLFEVICKQGPKTAKNGVPAYCPSCCPDGWLFALPVLLQHVVTSTQNENVATLCVCVWGGNAILKRKACMGPGVGAQRRGPVPKRMSDENHHDCTGPP